MRALAYALVVCACAGNHRAVAQYYSPSAANAAAVGQYWDSNVVGTAPAYAPQPDPQTGSNWIAPNSEQWPTQAPVTSYIDPSWGGQPVILPDANGPWCWQMLPDGLIYRSYWAGVHEPRLGGVLQHIQGGDSFIDGNVGGRVGLIRYGTTNAILPQGWELDIEAAAMLRLTLDYFRDFESADYRIGIPLTYGIENWQFKLAVYHLSSHMGDEFAIANPGALATRINYVRDEIVFGTSVYPIPVARLYGEVGWAFNTDGGSEPWETQFGVELSEPGPTGFHGTPFFAVNGHLRQEVDWGGDVSSQLGWLWRGNDGQVLRLGLHYFNGKSSQYQFFNQFEEQIGVGMWYDF
jgi:hypothetical protein